MRSLALMLTLSMVGACSNTPTAPDLTFRVVGIGRWTATAPGSTVITEADAWSQFLAITELRAPSGRPEDPLAPPTFGSEMAIALFLGGRPTTGYDIRIDEIERQSGTIAIHATEIIPCVGATVITYPLTVIVVPKTNDPVKVSWSRQPLVC